MYLAELWQLSVSLSRDYFHHWEPSCLCLSVSVPYPVCSLDSPFHRCRVITLTTGSLLVCVSMFQHCTLSPTLTAHSIALVGLLGSLGSSVSVSICGNLFITILPGSHLQHRSRQSQRHCLHLRFIRVLVPLTSCPSAAIYLFITKPSAHTLARSFPAKSQKCASMSNLSDTLSFTAVSVIPPTHTNIHHPSQKVEQEGIHRSFVIFTHSDVSDTAHT